MPRDIPAIAGEAAVLPLSQERETARFRVRGLLGNPALANWIEAELNQAAGAACRASAATGVVRIAVNGHDDATAWPGRLLESLRSFGPVVVARRPRVARRRRQRDPALAVPRDAPAAGAAAEGTIAPQSEPADLPRWHAIRTARLLRELNSQIEGLRAADARQWLQRDGANEIADISARSDAEILAAQFKSVPVALLAGSGLLALATRARGDAAAIGAVLAANATIGYVTERRAEQTVSALRRLAPRDATVLRDGKPVVVPVREIVVGDVLVLKPGESVAADARVLQAHRLSVNEAALTGESLPVRKDAADRLAPGSALGERRNMLHMGTVVSGGSGLAVVVATGERTVLGSIRALAQATDAPRTRLQRELDALGKTLALGAAGLCVGVFGLGLLRGRAALPMLRTAVSLGVAAIPEGLPAVATSLLASGIRKLQGKQVYARRLDAIENLGAVDLVGFDKTGTLTQNRMIVAAMTVGTQRHRFDPNDASHKGQGAARLPADTALVCALCSEVERDNGSGWRGSPTELALIEFAQARFGAVDVLRRRHRRIAVKQRSEHHPYMVALHAPSSGDPIVTAKGRPQEVLERCTHWFDGASRRPLTAADRRRVLRENDALARSGHRVLALAIKRQKARKLGSTGGLTLIGLVGLADPLREGIATTISRFRAAGIRTMMLTGDQVGTAQAIASAIGLDHGHPIADAAALPEDAQQLRDTVAGASGFARSSPGMKLQIVRALQQLGHVVAMTGDGINDGPALRTADVGVAMGASGSDFAHAMSDLVLRNDHPDGLLDAIAEGRTAYLNVKKAVQYLVATNLSELALMTVSVAAGLPEPLDPMALLWTNLITDVSPAIALGLEPPEPDILQRPPFPRTRSLLTPPDWTRVAADAGLIAGVALAAYVYGLRRYGPTPAARTLAFEAMTCAQLLYAFPARSEAPLGSNGRARLRENPWLSRTVLLSLGAQAATVLVGPLRRLLRTAPLSPADVAVVAACAVVPSLVRELAKRRQARLHPTRIRRRGAAATRTR